MVSNEPVISLRDVGVQFARNRRRHRSIRELLIRGRTGTRPDEFWPFRHLNLDIDEGEQIGVVGRNGMGKSTLLRLIAASSFPTRDRSRSARGWPR
jgi:ABC-type polysaccharide/polyol phosphate transport system, ATPase component